MKAQRRAAILLLLPLALAAAACEPDGQGASQGSTTPAYQRAEAEPLRPEPLPVRIGELGRSFPACYAMARLRERVVTEPVPVRSAPSEQGAETERMALGTQFFICTRSHDQRWFAIVWDEAAGASPACGVSRPVTARQDYRGPCKSGWIPSALVRLESGIIHEPPAPEAPTR